MTATAHRYSFVHMATPLGRLLLAANANALVGAWFEGQKDHPQTNDWQHDTSHPVLQQAQQQLNAYFAGERSSFDLPLAFDWGTDFQRQVWTALTHIGFGEITQYGVIAARIGRPQASRAVGAAIGMNPISVIVPCHRVLGQNGSLTGYNGGIDRKRALLRLEGHAIA